MWVRALYLRQHGRPARLQHARRQLGERGEALQRRHARADGESARLGQRGRSEATRAVAAAVGAARISARIIVPVAVQSTAASVPGALLCQAVVAVVMAAGARVIAARRDRPVITAPCGSDLGCSLTLARQGAEAGTQLAVGCRPGGVVLLLLAAIAALLVVLVAVAIRVPTGARAHGGSTTAATRGG